MRTFNWRFWQWSLATQILVGLLIGASCGLLVQALGTGTRLDAFITNVTAPVGQIFLRLIFMVIVPLVISAIALGVAGMGDLRQLGRVGVKCLGMTLLLAGASVVIGLVLVNVIQPGHYLSAEKSAALEKQYGSAAQEKVTQGGQSVSATGFLLGLIPTNPIAEAAKIFTAQDDGKALLAVMVFSVLVGLAIISCPEEKTRALTALFDSVFTISLKIIDFAMKLAPVCVACLAFNVTARLGFEIVTTLGAYVATVMLGYLIHGLVTYPVVLRTLGGKSPIAFYREIQEVIYTAFGTSSSNATLPVSLEVAEQKLKLPPQLSRFVLTVGATANQNGTALYEGVTVLFLAQVFGVDLSLGQQIVVALLCILAGIGTAGVPGGSLPLVVGVLVTVGVPGESIAIILGIDRFLDMCRTVLNVTGDLVIAVVVASKDQTGALPPDPCSKPA
ncbi:MAG: dicarboxylate/amino acid:cation symporter [Verrucomicrobia bacterium Tous-C9LFEB]|nr:MAG: dicarboxylate/amino acid:cation symporter [Verrucomicrobia bacterium Tous-C9LFEB]